MKLRVIHDAPEAVISRGFNRLHWQDFDAVIILRPKEGWTEEELYDRLIHPHFYPDQGPEQ